jgi:hypothetical protein
MNANVTAYVGTKHEEMMLAVINKGPIAVQLQLPERFRSGKVAHRWELRGSTLSSKEGVHFIKVPVPDDMAVSRVDGYSAAILQAGSRG